MSADTRLSISDLPPTDTTLLLSSEAVRSRGKAELIAGWVERGGTLVYFLNGGSRFRNEFVEGFTVGPDSAEQDEEESDHFLEFMEIRALDSGEETTSISYNAENYDLDLPGGIVFTADWVVYERGFQNDLLPGSSSSLTEWAKSP